MTTIPGLGASGALDGGDLIVVRQVGQTVDTKVDLDTVKTFMAFGSGGTDWGDIGGTLSDQTDLQTALDGKLSTSSTTTDVGEGSNLYFTNERVDDRVAALIQNGTGISWTYNDVSNTLTPAVSLSGFSTTNLSEGSNLYFTDERVDDRVSALLQNGTGITWSYNDASNTFTPTVTITQYTDEMAQDAIASLIQNGTGITWSYNDGANTLTPTVSLSSFSTTNLSEGTNLYYTDERVDDRVAALIQNGTGISFSYNDGANTFTPTVSLSSFSTSNLSEGSNLYYTDTRADARIALQAGNANGLATLDGSGKIPTSQLPAIALVDVNTVASQVAQLALTAQEGDVAVRTDLNKSYIHNGGVAGTMADWTELLTPTDTVLSVNGQTGIVSLTTSHITEGSNLYFTDERAQDAVGAMVNTSLTYTDGSNSLGVTSRNINGTAFDHTADITITAAAGTLTGNTLNSSVTASSLTSVGTLTSLTLGGTLAMGANNITITGSIGATGARVTKVWATDMQVTNAIVGSVTGSAATLTTPRAIYGNNFDGSAALTQVIAGTFGGTNNGFMQFAGPTTSTKTFTLPNATCTILTTNAAVTIGQGGTGATTAAAAATALGLGTGDSPQHTAINLGHASDTTITRVSAGVIAVEGNTIYAAGGTDVPAADGGTGRSSHTAYAVICGGTTTTAAQQSIASVGTAGQVLTSNGAGALPTMQDAPGSIVEGTEQVTTSGTAFNFTSIPSTVKRIVISFYEVGLSGTDEILVQIGDSGGLETSGYISSSIVPRHTVSSVGVTNTTGFVVSADGVMNTLSGHMILTRMNNAGTKWSSSHVGMINSGSPNSCQGGGSKTLSAVLDRLTITRSGSNTFDSGSVNITYES